ncbi:MAG: hypothetical protein KA072_14745 [Thermoanaerobaculaceae bacterium]|nr:hypothetical protein [Thermoanaerobaculaceae bacterium]MDI9622954.1 hypothetical protein [Acidobacteriota bacterium]HPW56912.1 hypothetical protein [Thermoanaerobaculaceae bacterium]
MRGVTRPAIGAGLWLLRPYFLYRRPLLGRWCRAASETVRELMAEAAAEPTLKPGMVAMVQTFGDALTWNPHVKGHPDSRS